VEHQIQKLAIITTLVTYKGAT